MIIEEKSIFDTVVDRRGTNSSKWSRTGIAYPGHEDSLPMWVADMDFPSPPAVIEGLRRRVEHGVFGYTFCHSSYYQAIVDWQKRHGWVIQQDWLLHSPGVVTALTLCVHAFTQPGDSVLIQPPIYPPFFKVVKNNDRNLVYNPLRRTELSFELDLDDLGRKLQDPSVKMMMLCHPHNPVGRVWRREELLELAKLCLRNEVLLISDEIHSDFIFPPLRHYPVASLGEDIAANTVTCSSASKTFNLAGLVSAYFVVSNPERRQQLKDVIAKLHVGMTNVFGTLATESSYRHGREWLEQLLGYLQGNYQRLCERIKSEAPLLDVLKLEGTYLPLVDYQRTGMTEAEAKEALLREKVALEYTSEFTSGEGRWLRVNIACPRSILDDGIDRIVRAFKS